MLKKIMKFLKDEEGASAVEYGLIVGLVAVAAVAVLLTMGGNLSTLFDTVATKLGGAATSSSSP
ncbi:MAG: Flp family type IVb pilin [Pseudomonadota bacterium]|mgnify:CR=1 FL=1